MSDWLTRLSLLLLTISLNGCQTIPFSESLPAKISAHSQESLIELRQAVKSLMNERDVLVSASAFNKTDKLIIQRRPIKGPGGRIIDTRVDELPFIFRLQLRGSDCFLYREDTEGAIQLYRANCTPL